jgi:purine-binding chemotaxis protein CheW
MNSSMQIANLATSHEPRQSGQYLTFSLQGEIYGVPLLNVREIIGYTRPTRIPAMPEYMQGVINLRGHGVPVIDLARRFGRPATELHQRSSVVILETGGQVLGFVVDSVDSVADFAPEQIEPAPSFGTGLRREFVLGMARTREGFTVLLDIGRVFSDDEFAQLEQVSQTRADETAVSVAG